MLGKRQLVTDSALTLAVLSALLLIAARPAQTQTEKVLYNFTGGTDGGNPYSRLTSDSAGNFYGTTFYGGFGLGTVFELSPNGSGGWNETVLYNFCSAPGCVDGAYPTYSYVTFDNKGNLYGTANQGGANGYGVVFELSRAGASWTETVLYNFGLAHGGVDPVNGLIMDSKGNLYGTTEYDVSGGIPGTVFELSTSGGGWTEQVIYDNADIYYGGLTMDAAGDIFGTTLSTAFELLPNGKGGWNPTVIHTFRGRGTILVDGSRPDGTPVLDQAGNLYGTTYYGGANGYGTVYRLSPGRTGWTEKILYSFGGGPKGDGSYPFAGIVFDATGNIYGTTVDGGQFGSAGTVYELAAPLGKGSYRERVLWSFNDTDGFEPYGSLILDSAGNLFGATADGGSSNRGVVFEMTP